jgi:hypothetical protein
MHKLGHAMAHDGVARKGHTTAGQAKPVAQQDIIASINHQRIHCSPILGREKQL